MDFNMGGTYFYSICPRSIFQRYRKDMAALKWWKNYSQFVRDDA